MISVPVKATLPYASQINHKTMITVLEFQMIQTLQEQEHLGIWQRSNMWFFLIIIISFTIVISLKAMDNGHLRQRLKHVFCIIPTPKTQVHLCELTVSHGWKLPHYHPSIIIIIVVITSMKSFSRVKTSPPYFPHYHPSHSHKTGREGGTSSRNRDMTWQVEILNEIIRNYPGMTAEKL